MSTLHFKMSYEKEIICLRQTVIILPLGQSWLLNYGLKSKVPGPLCVPEFCVCGSTLTKTV